MSLKLLTFNTWGLKYVSKHRQERLRAIADELADDTKHDYDIVALQEVWCDEDWEYLTTKCNKKYPHSRRFYAGIIAGPGLCVLSRIPIESTFLYRFPINGSPSAFFRGDWYVGKSVGVIKLAPLREGGRPIALLNSHMHAPYALNGSASYLCHRTCQAWDFAHLAEALRSSGYAVVVVGDLNSRPGSIPYRIFQQIGQLSDSWELVHGTIDSKVVAQLSPEEQVITAGTTCDSLLNTWRLKCAPQSAARLDFALVSADRIKPTSAKVVFTTPIPNVGSYSDHFAYATTLEILNLDAPFNKSRSSPSSIAAEPALYRDIIAVLDAYQKTWRRQVKWRSFHVFVSILVIIGLHVSVTLVSFIAPWSSVLFLFTSTLITVLAVTNFFIVALFLPSERRNIIEVRQEVLDRLRLVKE
ncbi:Inositol phosphosphingolipid phospholipase C [Komagataella phaffii CBS 7435]|uniref:Mitochondrial membrane localized inositol phosphosphingolipid phospholipase C n=2 Tax=Komagataella phaffii TaxID=460519 RepID=C4R961_KOMPG|nr:Mitochondrial membrane localized inositol phosphosphingolipid phospholipase C [Komagataella phaffii GS115]AOA64599.1 GQ67_05261T0 [Komagataella phaffii]AOA70163.1 GQ68_05243T0 [Komagataella phaffii GS115]CAY72136.1 Mitochondrial membrane localized inositol phosphosphingolipid phospholipase C [Komagataella phaffii GS115]SDB75113.1 Inositol phosphosphingolipid phospholipase C [Komagataella phaffii CBS 7435]